jgi:zinc protease
MLYKGKEEKSTVVMAWFRPEKYSEAGGVAATVLTEYLDILLTEKIREALGAAYSISVYTSLSPLPPDGELTMEVYFPCDPQRVRELRAAIMAEIQRIADGDIQEDTFWKAVEALIKTYEESMQSNLYIAQNFASRAALFDLPLEGLEKIPELYNGVNLEDIQDMARRLLENGPMEVILYPEGWNE